MLFILNPILPFYLLKVTRFLIKIKYFRIYFSYKNCTSLPLEKGHSLFPSDTPLKMRSCQAPTFEQLAEVQPHHQKEQGGGAHYIIVGKGVRVPPFKAPTPWPSLPAFLKSLFLLPSFLFHSLLRYFKHSPLPTLTQPPTILIRAVSLPWFKQISKGQFYSSTVTFKLCICIHNYLPTYLATYLPNYLPIEKGGFKLPTYLLRRGNSRFFKRGDPRRANYLKKGSG